ncbi:hypothetical protein BDV93DRAFT_544117 [Ceratobasidium sp. AG-I]|nr:hypothetical protein BDV93DRAFT_544117 [Ceratobasidium sp. AG-I]
MALEQQGIEDLEAMSSRSVSKNQSIQARHRGSHRIAKLPVCEGIVVDSANHAEPFVLFLALVTPVPVPPPDPALWREVRGVHRLFALIPGVIVQEVGYNRIGMEIPDLLTCDFARFNVYSRFVESLDILQTPYHTYNFSNWGQIASYTKQNTLLPNLRALAYGCERSKDDTYINWIAAFLSPTVLEVHTHNAEFLNRSDLSFPSVLGFLQLVTDRSPLLSAISFFPTEGFLAHRRIDREEEELEGSEDEGWKAPADVASSARDFERVWGVSYPEPRPYGMELLGRTQHLTRLTSNLYILSCEMLKILGSLPQLEHLTVFDELAAHEELVYSYDGLPENSFPALRKLSLILLPNALIPHIWTIPPLVRRLTHVIIRINGDEQGGNQHVDPFGDEDDEPTLLVDFLPTLCELSPHLEEFVFDMDAVFGGNSMGVLDSTAEVFPRMALESLAQLPLQKLDLRVVKLRPMSQMCETLASCSTLRELYLQNEPVTFTSLMHFTQLPSLECLQVSIVWESITTLDTCIRTVNTQSHTFRRLQCSRAPPKKLSEQLVKKLASFFVALWPNLLEVSYVPETPYPLGHYPDPDLFSHMTACVRSLRQPKALNKRKRTRT